MRIAKDPMSDFWALDPLQHEAVGRVYKKRVLDNPYIIA